MKSFDCPSNIGEGLFSNEAVKVQLNFPDGTSGIFDVHAMTQDMVVEFEKGGVKFQDYANQEEALENSAVIINRVVAGGEYKGVKIVDQLRRRILSNAGLTATLLNVSRKLAEETIEVEEKNSES